MVWFDAFDDILTLNRPLKELTTLRIGGAARYFFSPRSRQQLADLLVELKNREIPVWFLGRGSNILVDDSGVDGAVISLLEIRSFRPDSDPEGDLEVEVDAGFSLPSLVSWAVNRGLKGLEPCVGIPASVGGAIHQNAGGGQGAFGDRVISAVVVTPEGRMETRDVSDLGLGYRRSALGGAAVVSARIRLGKDDVEVVKQRAKIIMDHRKATQPLQKLTAGCIFMNPSGGRTAGQLLDDAGMKGKRRGRACISEKHANFIVNMGDARARDVRDLIQEGRDRVLDCSGVSLVQEILQWPGLVMAGSGMLV